jgi:hypothetical protein
LLICLKKGAVIVQTRKTKKEDKRTEKTKSEVTKRRKLLKR